MTVTVSNTRFRVVESLGRNSGELASVGTSVSPRSWSSSPKSSPLQCHRMALAHVSRAGDTWRSEVDFHVLGWDMSVARRACAFARDLTQVLRMSRLLGDPQRLACLGVGKAVCSHDCVRGQWVCVAQEAKLTPRHVGHIEAHGTGTPLGDPIELGALQAVNAGASACLTCDRGCSLKRRGCRASSCLCPFLLGSSSENLETRVGQALSILCGELSGAHW